MVRHARASAPDECCGFLVGAGGRVEFAIPMTNHDSRPRTGFRINPREHIAIRRALREMVPGHAIVGVYHSHPNGPATPSERDVKEANYPDWLFAIVGRGIRLVRVFSIRRGRVASVRVRWR